MAKHRRVWNASVHERYVHEGRGCGSGSAYKPWVRVQDFASQGMASRVKGKTSGRVHHLMSNNELAYFYVLDWSDTVTDIREQYPLSDLDQTVRIAAQSGIRHPKDNVSGYPYILTCDFMVTTNDGLKARTLKTASELDNPRTLEKLEIERRYWALQKVDWKIITEHEITHQKAKNIEWLYTALGYGEVVGASSELMQAQHMMLQMLHGTEYSILEAARIVECEMTLPAGTGLQLFKHLALSKAIHMDLSCPLELKTRGAAS